MQPESLSLGETAEIHVDLDASTIQVTGEISEFVESNGGLYAIIDPGTDSDTIAAHIDNVGKR